MKAVMTVFKKELIDSIRDRRTLIAMVVMPLLLFSLLISISSRIISSQVKKAQHRTLTVGLLTNGCADSFRNRLLDAPGIEVIEDLTIDEGRSRIQSDSLDALIVFAPTFDDEISHFKPGAITLYYKMTGDSDIEKMRISRLLEQYEEELRTTRFKMMNLDESIIETLAVSERNLASQKEKIAETVGGFLPYLIIIFCFTGSMYPAIDLAAGEKERGTLETLLTSPVGKFQILLGKFGVVALTGILSAGISLLGLYLGITQARDIPPELLQTIMGILETRSIILLLSLLLPLVVFFASIQLSLSIFAKSFKEAQSIINPLMIAVIVPAFIGLMPGMELNGKTALIPILNVSLATKTILAGTTDTVVLAEVYASLVVFAVLGLLLCTRIFDREDILFRGA